MKHFPSFGTALRLMRNAKGIPQDGLGITQTNISKFELGKKAPSWERVGEIADHLDVHPLSLFTLAYMGGAREDALDDLLEVVQAEVREMITTLRERGY